MKNIFRIIEGYGNPENTSTLFDVQFLEITFSNYDLAVTFAWNHYNQKITNNPNWKSYFSSVTTANNTTEALAEIVKEMQGA